MDKQQKRFAGKVLHQKVDETKQKTKEVKVLNTEANKLQGADDETVVLNVLLTAKAFKSALKKLKIHDCGSNKLQIKEIVEVLADIQNVTKLKILCLRKGQGNKIEKECSKKCNTQSSTKSLFSSYSELARNESSSRLSTRSNSVDSECEALSTYKLMSLSKQSLFSTTSQYDYLGDEDENDDDDFDDEKFKKFLASVNCPFCLKHEDNKNSLTKHLDGVCTTFKSKIFVRNLDCPYSVFQILPNNAIKCNICPNSVQSNLKSYFIHSQSASHILAHNSAASRKNYTDLIFCAPCKIQIPNNGTQILFHLEHEVHQRNAKNQRSTSFFRKRGVVCVYSKEKKFKCLHCPPAECNHKSVNEILLHLESKEHLGLDLWQKGPHRKTALVYCMFCLAEVSVFSVIGHFNSSEHARKEEEEENNEFQLCFYCGFKCSKLIVLARHIEGCLALDRKRQKDSHEEEEFLIQESEESDKVLTQSEKGQERSTNENTSVKGRCIIVKDYPKMLGLYRYFKQFGEILEIEQAGENDVLIKFREEKTVDQILESGRSIEINGVKPKIIRKEELDSSTTGESTNSRPVENNDGSDVVWQSRNVMGAGNSSVHENFFKGAVRGGTLESLFNRVSSHLSYTVIKPDCEEFLNVALDCEKILKLGKCHFVGFLKCGLTFPAEKITIYYELSNSLINEECLDNSTSLTESVLFNENMCKKCIGLFKNSQVVSQVVLKEKSVPIVEFYHNKTHKLCTITFRQSDSILSDELRHCLKDNKKLRSFVLIIRFWLSVHRLEIREFETVIISLLLFFLLRSGVVDTPSENFRKRPGHELVNKLVTDKDRYQNIQEHTTSPKHAKTHTHSVMEMFQNFLLFLNQFDFEKEAICLPLLYPVPKTALLQEPLKKYLCKRYYPHSPVLIMDPFLFNNLAEDVEKAVWDSLLKTVRETIEHYHIS